MKYNIHTHYLHKEKDTLELVNQDLSKVDLSIPYFSVGIHPWYIEEHLVEEQLNIIEMHLQQANCLALGECGLDKKIDIPLTLQKEVLVRQLLLAEKNKKAVILHVVSAYQEIITLKKQLNLTVPLIVHGFNKHQQVAESLWKNGFHLSFGRALLGSKRLQDTLALVPEQYIFLETDDDQIISIEEIYNKAAEYQPKIEQIVASNFKRIFRI
ncbi:TatD family hydrolase [Myroides sp. WP-1]|uniref:TatD family hydrolase n=1 Tax=Myroides sp. WP-1 TaxID=2759944 RepID=UPI0015FE18C6|nr:TatD family hydrolase [Myroides sp. WP-1]MBB1139225.1 TatD family hydrolase [Myroides sp. WP-1]